MVDGWAGWRRWHCTGSSCAQRGKLCKYISIYYLLFLTLTTTIEAMSILKFVVILGNLSLQQGEYANCLKVGPNKEFSASSKDSSMKSSLECSVFEPIFETPWTPLNPLKL